MKKELDQELVANYPSLYRDRHGNKMKTLMCFGFPGDGWFDILNSLSAKLDPLGVIAVQVKEKFGTLSFYYTWDEEADWKKHQQYVEDAVAEAEELSAETCERCGQPGKLHGGGWLTTQCDECWKKTTEGEL